jgi:hypothetical protein
MEIIVGVIRPPQTHAVPVDAARRVSAVAADRAISRTADIRLAKSAEVVLTVPRGERQRVAFHGGTLVALEAMVLAFACRTPRPGPEHVGTARSPARRGIWTAP